MLLEKYIYYWWFFVSFQVLTVREDGVVLVQKKDRFVVEFSDGTRITSLNVNTQLKAASSCIFVENPAFAKVEFSHSGKCFVGFPGCIMVECFDGEYKIMKPDTITMTLTRMGELDCTIESGSSANVSKQYAITHSLEKCKPLLTGIDCTGIQYSVLHTGQITKKGEVKMNGGDVKGLSKLSPKKIFIINEDDSCYEIHPQKVLQEAIKKGDDDENSLVISEEVPQCVSCKATTIVTSHCSRSQSTGMDYAERSIVPLHLKNIPFQGVCAKSSWRRFGVSVGKSLMIDSYNKPVDTPQHVPKKVITYRQLVQLPSDCFSSMHSVVAKYVQLCHSIRDNADTLRPFTVQKVDEQVVPSSICYPDVVPDHLITLFEAEQGKDAGVISSIGHTVTKPTEKVFLTKFDDHIPKSQFPVSYFKSSEGSKVLQEISKASPSVSTTKKQLPRNTHFDTVLRISNLPEPFSTHSDRAPVKEPGMLMNKCDQQIVSCGSDKITFTSSSPFNGKTSFSPLVRPVNPNLREDSSIQNSHLSKLPEIVQYSSKPKMVGEDENIVRDTHSKQPPNSSSVQPDFTSFAATWTRPFYVASNVKVKLGSILFVPFVLLIYIYVVTCYGLCTICTSILLMF